MEETERMRSRDRFRSPDCSPALNSVITPDQIASRRETERSNASGDIIRSNSRSNTGRKTTVSAKFVRAKTEQISHGDSTTWSGLLLRSATSVINSKFTANLFAVIVLTDAVCTCVDVDARAAGQETPRWAQLTADICLVLYTVEMTFFLMAKGRTSLTDWMVLVDLFVIACGYVEMLLQYLYEDLPLQTISLFRALRLVRILRLTRLLRRTRGFRELQKLVRMMATCIKALFWSFVFCFMVMTVWALLIVEIINPLMQDLDLGDCEGCVKATSSVMHANLLLFKTVIAGDSWGDIAVPVIYAHPFSAIIFMGSLLTLIFGVLNLIVAVVVDTFAEARQRDVLNLAEEMEFNLAADQKFLERIFQRIDADGSGQVTFDELLEGARRDPEFQSRLRVMDIDESDLQQLFEMIDVHGEGEIEASEFITPLTRWVHESKTAPRFIKYNVLRSLNQQEELFNLSRDAFDVLDAQINEIRLVLKSMAPPNILDPGRDLTHLHQAGSMDDILSMNTEEMERTDNNDSMLEVAGVGDVDAEVEQPRPSKSTWLPASPNRDAQDSLKTAVQSLERYVLAATEAALKKSMALVEKTMQERWSDVHARSSSAGKMRGSARLQAMPEDLDPGSISGSIPNRRRSKRIPSMQAVLAENIFTRNQRESQSHPVGAIVHDSEGSLEMEKTLSSSRSPNRFVSKPKRRMPVGSFNEPGAGLPAEAMPARWRPSDGASSNDMQAFRRHERGTMSMDPSTLRGRQSLRDSPANSRRLSVS